MASATDAEEALCSTKEKDNFQRLTRLLMCGGVRLLREKFDSFHSPSDLPLKLGDPAIMAQLKRAKTSKAELACLYPSPGTFGKSTDFDITLTFRLLRTICNLTPPPLTGSWDDPPNSADHSLEADLVRIKYYRNSVYGHNQKMEITYLQFSHLWKEISEALLRIAGTISKPKRDEWKKFVDELLYDPLTTEAQKYVDELQLWYQNDIEVKDAVWQVRDQLQQVSMDVRDQQQVNVDIRDQLQQLNQRLATIAEEAEYKKCKELHADQISPLNMSSSETTGIDAIDAMDMVQTMSSHGVKEAQTTLEKKSMSSSELIDIDGIDDIVDMAQAMLSLGVSSKGLRTLDEMKNRVKETLRSSEKKSSWTAKERSPSPPSSSSEFMDIDIIDDIMDMIHTMTVMGVSSKGLRTLDEMKNRVKETLKTSKKKSSWTAKEAFSILSEAKDENARKKEVLLNLYAEGQNCLNNMDDKILTLLQTNIGNVQEKMRNHQVQLKQREYFLLVAGETGSGKSSLVNLILGEELLPYSVLSTTTTICELKYGRKREIVAHFKYKDPETGLATKVFSIAENPDESSEQGYLQQISPFVHVKSDREKGSIYKKIELFWPHQLLERGVVIIDSPGIGKSEIMDEIVTQYLPQAFAFIYVINSANSGGVQIDRLENLLEEVRKVTLEGQGEFSPKCTLFVCNKWDQVPEEEIEEVQNHVVKKLTKYWPGLVPESQIIHMSSKNASTAQNYGIITEEFFALMSGVRSMVLKSIEARLEIHWKWLDYFLSRIIYQAKAFVMNAYRDQDKVVDKMALINLRLYVIEKQQTQVMADLHNYFKARADGAVQKLSEYLKSDDVRARFTSWTLDEVPQAESSWDVTKSNITKALGSRLQEIIEHWEEDNQVFSHARESLLQHFQERYNFVKGQLRKELQGAVTNDDLDLPESDPSTGSFSTAEKIVIGVTSPIWVPLTLVALVIGAPVVGIISIKNKLEDRSRIKKYEKDKCAFMDETSADYLDDVTNESVLRFFVKDQLKEASLSLKQIEARIPELIQADKMLCEQLGEETRSKNEIQELYLPLLDEASRVRGHLAVFGLKEVRALDISSEELEWKEDMSCHLGSGAFATVYQGKMRRHGKEQPVALKVCKELLDAKNASLIMAEVELLRKLEHPHIVQFYGTSLLKKDGTIRVILVMEKCKENLKSRIFGHPESAPAKSAVQVKEVCRWAKEITVALVFIHKQGVIHRDLTLENILLSEEDSVKITDVGVSKDAKDITGTLAGTPVYIAPEVFNSEVYDNKADIYNLGIILWEMWYGQQAYAGVNVSTPEAFFKLIEKGHRPEHVKGSKERPPLWRELMNDCWNRNPEKRPSAQICYEQISKLS